MLSVEGLWAGYGGPDVVRGVSLSVAEGEVVAVVGPNGAGKTTTLRAVVGLVEPSAGTVRLDGEALDGLPPHRVYRRGVALVPEDRGIFPDLTVAENLRVPVGGGGVGEGVDLAGTFPELAERRDAKGRHLSGGQRQLLAVARAVRRRPRVLLLDEPSEGLAPDAVDRIASVVEDLAARGTAVVVVEGTVDPAFALASEGHVLDDGRIVRSGPVEELRREEDAVRDHLGIGDAA